MLQSRLLRASIGDISRSIQRIGLVSVLGVQDVKQRYRRSTLGPFWLTISMGVMIATIGLVFGQLFRTPMDEYLPYLSIGIILWGFISTTISEGCLGFISAEGIIKQLPIPLFVHILRVIWRNLLILGHNSLILPIVYIVVHKMPSYLIFLAIPGIFLVALNILWITLLLAVVCARYRDLPQIVASIFQVIFYLTPIVWMPSSLPDRVDVEFLSFNPFFNLIEIVRGPLLGVMPPLSSWIISIFMALAGWILSLLIYGRYKARIAFWV